MKVLGLFSKKQTIELYAPVSGKMIALEDVPDKVFSSKMMGEGVAFELEEGTVCAPCDGIVSMIFPTLHAFGMKLSNGVEILIHIGIDTVALNGNGFEKLVNQGEKVKRGTPIINVDMEFMKNNNIILSMPMIITENAGCSIEINECKWVEKGEQLVITCKKN